MLPVSLLVDWCRPKKSYRVRRDGTKVAVDRRSEEERQREMEGRLLVAVPEGSTATECQAIRRALWKNPKIQRWWNKTDPFAHPSSSRKKRSSRKESLKSAKGAYHKSEQSLRLSQ
jgi:type II secretory pathway component PulJ